MASDSGVEEVVRTYVYDVVMKTGKPPSVAGIADGLHLELPLVKETLACLHERRALVLQPSGEVLMAMPFSAVPTAFVAETRAYTAYANCAWDALGIAAMVKEPATIRCSCADCGDALVLDVSAGIVTGPPVVLHFALPVRHWWDAVVFT